MTDKQVKDKIDQTVRDYVEKKISAHDISAKLEPLATGEIYSMLTEAGMSDLIGILDQLADVDYYLSNETFNHHDAGNILSVIDKYYESIKDKS